MEISTHLTFDGRCEEAFRFYEKALGAKRVFSMTYGQSPMAKEAPTGFSKKILHATLKLGKQTIMGCDAPKDRFEAAAGIRVSLSVKQPKEAERIFAALRKGGEVAMPIQETFWARRFGMCTDRFGTPWMINCEKPS